MRALRRDFWFGSFFVLVLLILSASAVPFAATGNSSPVVVLISIDGLRPDYILEAEQNGLRVPELRRFLTEGAYATGVTGVIPTVTYPSHTTLLTGVVPARHGVIANTTFDPLQKNFGGWYWYAEDIRVPTLWDAAAEAGLVTANVHWPVSAGARVRFNLPQYWRSGTDDDRKLLRLLNTPGLQQDLERGLEPYADGIDESIAGDERRARFAVRLLELKRPNFMAVYLTALDHEQHESGPFSASSDAVLERLDALVGALRATAARVSEGRAVVSVVSDHGFVRTTKNINLLAAFREAGLIEFDAKEKPKSWEAAPWFSGGTAAVMLREPGNAAVAEKVRQFLRKLAADPQSGIERVLDADELRARGGFPGAQYVVALKPGYKFASEVTGPLVTDTKISGMHGYLPENREMNSSFLITGPGIPEGRSLGQIDMRDIAPTLAPLLGVRLSQAEGRNLFR